MTQPLERLKSRPDHVPVLDGVRGCAILLVLASHVASGVVPAGRLDDLVLRAWGAGWIGVDLFFCLSGFLITGILLDTRADPGYFRLFFARRALRILPLYWVFLASLALTAWLLRGGPQWGALMTSMPWHLAYLSNVLVANGGWSAAALQTGHLWSLAVEEQFYLTWPLVVLAVGAERLRRGVTRMLLYLPVIRGVALAAGLFAVTVHVLTPFRADALASGALLALIVRAGDRARLARQLRHGGALAVVALVAVVAWSGGLAWTSVWLQTVGYTALAVVFAAVIDAALGAAPRSRLARALGSGPMRSFGKYSYSIYLFHAPLLLVADRFGIARASLPLVAGSRIPALACYTVLFSAAMWLVGFTTWWGCERHFLRLKRHFEYDRGSRPDATIPARARAA